MNYDTIRHINSIYDELDFLNYRIEQLQRERENRNSRNPLSRFSRRNDRNRLNVTHLDNHNFLFDDHLFPNPLNTINSTNLPNLHNLNNLSNIERTRHTVPNTPNTSTLLNILNQQRQNHQVNTNSPQQNNEEENNNNNNNPINNPTTTNVNQNAPNFNENFATSFAQRVHNMLTTLNTNNTPFQDIPNIQIETHSRVIISHKSVSNNTTIELYNHQNNSDTNNDENTNINNHRNETTNANINTNVNTQVDTTNNEHENNRFQQDNRCVICMESLEDNTIVRRLNKCNHVFHIDCIDKWFESKITCPTCRQDIRDIQHVPLGVQSNIPINTNNIDV